MQSEIISSVKNRAYTVGSLDSQSQYFEYVDIWDLTVEKIPHNKEAAAAEVVGSNPTRSIFITLGNYGIKLPMANAGNTFYSSLIFFYRELVIICVRYSIITKMYSYIYTK
jgi:hypothetical protein